MAGALAGLKIIEVGTMVSAPYAAKLMADMGAEVIKLEPPAAGDPARTRGPFPGGQPHPDKSGLFLYLNANKFGVTLDIAQAEGLDLLAALAERADVLIHNMAPPEMDRTGLSFERLNQRNPRLVMTSIAPFGLTGAHRNWRAEELTVWSSGGVCVLNGAGPNHPELPPLKTFGSQSGFQAGVHAAVATMGAVFGRRRGARASTSKCRRRSRWFRKTKWFLSTGPTWELSRPGSDASRSSRWRRWNARTDGFTCAASRSINGAISSP